MPREPDRVRKIAFDVVPVGSASQAILHTLRSCGPEWLGHRGNAERLLFQRQGVRLAVPRPADDLEATVEVLDHGSAAFDPVAAIDVAEAGVVADHRVMDMTADH